MYTVKEVAKLLQMYEHTVRYYCDLGLVPSLKRNKNGNRIFDEESINWLLGVKYLRNSGMSIKATQEYVKLCLEGDCTIEKRYDIIMAQKEALEKKIKEMNEQYEYLQKKSEMYVDIINNKMDDITNPALWETSDTML